MIETVKRWTRPAVFGAIIVGGCDRAPVVEPVSRAPVTSTGSAWLEDVAARAGIDFAWESGHMERFYLPEITGGGAALFDMDGDGDLDAYLVQGGSLDAAGQAQSGNRLLENQGDGTFVDVSQSSGADDRGYGMGAATGDYDNDGDVDLYVLNVGDDVLLRNDGTGRFTDATSSAGIDNPGWSSSAAFLDYDRDGDLDLIVLNYMLWAADAEIDCYNTMGARDYCAPASYDAPARDVLYRNNGDGTFTDVTEAAGMIGAVGTGLGVVCGDFNGDRWTDIFVANDGLPDHLWFNRRDGTFIEFGTTIGVALDQEGRAKAGMGVAAADIDDDGDLDLIVCNLGGEADSFFLNEGQFFRDATIPSGISASSRLHTRFGLGWVDFDNDGSLDLYEANGRVARFAQQHADDPYAEPNALFRGRGARFEPVAPAGGTTASLIHTSRGAAFGDVDNDGGIDVLVVNRDAPAYLLRNVVPDRGHWIMLDLRYPNGAHAIGATAEVSIGDRVLRRDCRTAYSIFSANDPRVHFGLGDVTTAPVVTVYWPDGTTERFDSVTIDAITTLVAGTGVPGGQSPDQ